MNKNDLNRFGTLALLAMAVSISACGGGDSEATGAPSPSLFCRFPTIRVRREGILLAVGQVAPMT